uniref:Putative prokaryotic JAB domain contining protein n=1 Tax=viral metagenome TaxID=1070528 RepID=A0A6H1ZLC7_9ZZZZ
MLVPIKASVFQQMVEYADWAHHHFESEISGWAHYNEKDGIYKLAPLSEQEASAAEVIAMPDMIKNKKYDMSDMIVQWHSHVKMGCSPSGPDDRQRNEIAELTSVVISIIVNINYEHSCHITLIKAGGITLDSPVTIPAKLSIYHTNDKVSQEVKQKLHKPKPVEVKIDKYRNYGYKQSLLPAQSVQPYKPNRYWAEDDWVEAYATPTTPTKDSNQLELIGYMENRKLLFSKVKTALLINVVPDMEVKIVEINDFMLKLAQQTIPYCIGLIEEDAFGHTALSIDGEEVMYETFFAAFNYAIPNIVSLQSGPSIVKAK